MKAIVIVIGTCLFLTACANQPETAADLNAAFNVAAAAEAAYTATPGVNPKTSAAMAQLLAAARAALTSWTNSPTPGQQAAVSAAIAALVAYQASAQPG